MKLFDKLTEYEYELAKQNAISDRIETLKSQQDEFNLFNKTLNRSLANINDVLIRSQEYVSSIAGSSRDDIKNLYEESSNKLNLVYFLFIFCSYFYIILISTFFLIDKRTNTNKTTQNRFSY